MVGRYRIYVLLCLAALLVWANTRAPGTSEVVGPTERSASLVSAGTGRQQSHGQDVFPAGQPRALLEPAERDPFATLVPKPDVAALQLPIPPAPQIAVTQRPAPPPLDMRFTGRMTAPDGTQIVFVAFGDMNLSITAGQTLPNGYRVDAIGERLVELSYPPLSTTARLDLPESPKYEIR